jgi:uncharacterized protein with HEPN domain
MREKIKDNARLHHMIEAIDNVLEFTNGVTFDEYKNNKILQFAIIKNLEIVGEAAYLLTLEFKNEHPEVAWTSIVGMRHVLVHGYYQISHEIVWATIDTDLKPLRKQIEKLIEQ